MDIQRIAELLQPFWKPVVLRGAAEKTEGLSKQQFEYISIYIDILLRWNTRMNLTAINDPDEIVTRHFGESLLAAKNLFPMPSDDQQPKNNARVIDIGSGAGFPGLPMKIWNSSIQLTLIESNQRKGTFLREVCRALSFGDVEVFTGRAQDYSGSK